MLSLHQDGEQLDGAVFYVLSLHHFSWCCIQTAYMGGIDFNRLLSVNFRSWNNEWYIFSGTRVCYFSYLIKSCKIDIVLKIENIEIFIKIKNVDMKRMNWEKIVDEGPGDLYSIFLEHFYEVNT